MVQNKKVIIIAVLLFNAKYDADEFNLLKEELSRNTVSKKIEYF